MDGTHSQPQPMTEPLVGNFEDLKTFATRVRDGDVSRDEMLARLRYAVLLVAAVAVVLGQLLVRAAAKGVETYGPTVRRVLGTLLERLGSGLKPLET